MLNVIAVRLDYPRGLNEIWGKYIKYYYIRGKEKLDGFSLILFNCGLNDSQMICRTWFSAFDFVPYFLSKIWRFPLNSSNYPLLPLPLLPLRSFPSPTKCSLFIKAKYKVFCLGCRRLYTLVRGRRVRFRSCMKNEENPRLIFRLRRF